MSDTLKKPVHIALLRPTQLDKLAANGKIVETPYGVNPKVEPPPLPIVQKERPYKVDLQIPKVGSSSQTKQARAQVKLRVLHERLPGIPADKTPPCDSCKTAACCRVFVVNITELEYTSGLYGDSAIKLTPEIFQQLNSRYLKLQMLTAPRHTGKSAASYYLEGKLGDPCPFLDANNRCGIYDIRPVTCRVYTCVGDSRVTEEMRQNIDAIDFQAIVEAQSPKHDK